MAINVENESVIAIREVPAWCEKHLGKRVHLSSIHRWRQRGARGARLESFLAGGSRYTSVEALHRFFAASTAAADGNDRAVHFESSDRAQKQAEAFLESEGA